MHLYLLMKNKPIVVTMPTNPSRIVVTDGFHITGPVEVRFSDTRIHYFKIGCAVEDDQLFVGLVLTVLLFAMGATSGILLLQILGLLPVCYVLFRYYISRREFIWIKPA